jgi:hypothetical protein
MSLLAALAQTASTRTIPHSEPSGMPESRADSIPPRTACIARLGLTSRPIPFSISCILSFCLVLYSHRTLPYPQYDIVYLFVLRPPHARGLGLALEALVPSSVH